MQDHEFSAAQLCLCAVALYSACEPSWQPRCLPQARSMTLMASWGRGHPLAVTAVYFSASSNSRDTCQKVHLYHSANPVVALAPGVQGQHIEADQVTVRVWRFLWG